MQLLGFQATVITDACSLAIGNPWVIKETAPRGNFRSDLLNELRKSLSEPTSRRPKQASTSADPTQNQDRQPTKVT